MRSPSESTTNEFNPTSTPSVVLTGTSTGAGTSTTIVAYQPDAFLEMVNVLILPPGNGGGIESSGVRLWGQPHGRLSYGHCESVALPSG